MLSPMLFLACANVADIEDGRQLNSVTILKDWFTSAALLPTDAGPVMIDAGYRDRNMTKALEAQGVDPADVVAILLTHGHTDHIGAIEIYTNAQLYALPDEQGTLDEESDGEVSIDVSLTDGEILTFGQHTVEVLAVPGHTPGSAVYLVDGVVLMGDTALLTGDGTLEPADEKYSADTEQAAESLKALAETLQPRSDEVDWLAPSHSGPSAGVDALVEYAGL
ncbi:MAG: glyoxylase-like metal-dependent hydrolase (beta-lactamase superfamily II) [Myxococcota bacterium]|jgi:glyoxylase-like metal-dependent hydrolase (beta-lactamase superfamily II)